MRRILLCLSLGLAMFVAVSAAGANIRRSLLEAPPVVQAKAAKVHAAAIEARTYRSPGRYHKLAVPSENSSEILTQARTSGGGLIADYGSFKLLSVDEGLLEEASIAVDSSNAVIRDDLNVLLLRSGAIDTTSDDAPGEFIGIGGEEGGETVKKKRRAASVEAARAGGSSKRLRLIQFVGPIKGEWLDQLRADGLEPIAYVPNNGYLVRGAEAASERMLIRARDEHSRSEGVIQWEAPFLDHYKIHPELVARAGDDPTAEVTVALQVARSEFDGGMSARQDLAAAKRLASSVIGDTYDLLDFINLKMRLPAGKVSEVASLANVINIEPWEAPGMLDERSSQIVSNALTADNRAARGPGYMNWLTAHGFGAPFNFAIDITDTGLDRGATAPDKLHRDFLDAAGLSRVIYNHDYTTDLDPGDTSGHGTINASIAAGATVSADSGMRDSEGFNHGLGVAPFAKIGNSKIFQSTGRFDVVDPYSKLISEAYRDGARISSNSWGSSVNSYTIDSQEYDTRARDAAPSLPGNQELVICFAAGNAGTEERIGAPGTGKNVISVTASEGVRNAGTDGCGVRDSEADNAMDIALFASGGKVDDGRVKPDLAAPGSHIMGAASQHSDFDGALVCGEDIDLPYFPKGQTLYTWSSGTSHATPAVAGGAALVRQFFINRGEEPSAALVKAVLLNTTTYMTGSLAGGDLPHKRQGWGLLNLDRAFNSTPKVFINQTTTFSDSGQDFTMTGEVKDPTQPFRVTIAWTDAPGTSGFAPWVNDLDLEVTINGQLYRGNNFKGQQSQPGGTVNTKDNVESVWLPAGTVGTFLVRIRASNIAGDGVPGNSDSTDQDFALVVYNAERRDAAVMAVESTTVAGGSDAVADPGETVTMRVHLVNRSPVAFGAARGTLTTSTQGVTLTAGSADFPGIAPGGTGESVTPFIFTVDRSVACGARIQFVLDVQVGTSMSRVPLTVSTGTPTQATQFTDDVEAGESKWIHGSLVKKKKNRVDTWVTTTRRFKSGGHAWFTPDLGKITDAHLDTLPLQLPADGRDLRLVFFHTFEFEPGEFDGGVLEISDGTDFADLGPKILVGGYTGFLRAFTDNPLEEREGWVNGRLGTFQQVVVNLSSYAGKTVVIRFRIGTDPNVKGLGWYIDDVTVAGQRVACAPAVD